jgi:hypothetical protein
VHLVTYDIEIAKAVSKHPKGDELSWDEAREGKAGISAICVWDSLIGRPFLYDARTVADCIEHLNSADLCVGWNSVEFDKPALEGFSKQFIHTKQLDIRQYVIAAVGDKYALGYKLGEVCGRTLGLMKSGDGGGAPSLARAGRFAELFDYNINDVFLTRALHNHIVEHHFVVTPDDKKMQIRKYPTKELA